MVSGGVEINSLPFLHACNYCESCIFDATLHDTFHADFLLFVVSAHSFSPLISLPAGWKNCLFSVFVFLSNEFFQKYALAKKGVQITVMFICCFS